MTLSIHGSDPQWNQLAQRAMSPDITRNVDLSLYRDPNTIDLLKKRKILLGEESVEALFTRVTRALIDVEDTFQTSERKKRLLKLRTYTAISKGHIAFGSPLLTNAGRPHMPTNSCVVIPVDLRRPLHEVKKIISPFYHAEMGSGFDLSDVENPVETLLGLNRLLLELETEVKRPPCGMALLRVDHPKVLEFCTLKRTADFSTWRFNLSVGVTDAFMRAVEKNEPWEFRDGTRASARAIFDTIAESAHYCGEPGLLFLDRVDQDNPVPSLKYASVSPCAEIAMAPGEVCQFSYINLAEMVTTDEGGHCTFDFPKLIRTTTLLTRLLDNAVEISITNAVSSPEVIEAKRRISVGICGFASLLIKLSLSYGSKESIDLLKEIMSVINFYSKQTSSDLAAARGRFPLFALSKYKDPRWLGRFKMHPTRNVSARMWEKLAQRISREGLRNAGTVAVPPTGVSARIIRTSMSLEPLFNLWEGVRSISSIVREKLMVELRLKQVPEAEKAILIRSIEATGQLPKESKYVSPRFRNLFRTASQISCLDQLRMLSAAQPHVDESISKTVNFPKNATVEEIRQCYMMAYRSGLKGMTVFRDQCLQERVLPQLGGGVVGGAVAG